MSVPTTHPLLPPASAGTVPEAGLFRRLRRLFDAWREVRLHAAAMNELSRLSDGELADIGLSRCDIPRVARADVRRPA